MLFTHIFGEINYFDIIFDCFLGILKLQICHEDKKFDKIDQNYIKTSNILLPKKVFFSWRTLSFIYS